MGLPFLIDEFSILFLSTRINNRIQFFISQNLLMSKIIALAALLLSLSVLVYSEKVTVTCTSVDTTTCPNAFQYTYTADGNTITKCVDECTFTTVDLQIFSCQRDFLGLSCDAKTCFYSINRERCLQFGQECTTQDYAKSECGSCNTNTCSSQKCYTSGGTEFCYPGQTCEYDSIHFGFKLCENSIDFLGTSCDCCGALYSSENLGECIANTNLDDAAVRDLATNFQNTYVYDAKQFGDDSETTDDNKENDTNNDSNSTDIQENKDDLFELQSGIKYMLLALMVIIVGLF